MEAERDLAGIALPFAAGVAAVTFSGGLFSTVPQLFFGVAYSCITTTLFLLLHPLQHPYTFSMPLGKYPVNSLHRFLFQQCICPYPSTLNIVHHSISILYLLSSFSSKYSFFILFFPEWCKPWQSLHSACKLFSSKSKPQSISLLTMNDFIW